VGGQGGPRVASCLLAGRIDVVPATAEPLSNGLKIHRCAHRHPHHPRLPHLPLVAPFLLVVPFHPDRAYTIEGHHTVEDLLALVQRIHRPWEEKGREEKAARGRGATERKMGTYRKRGREEERKR
jgi:hypothetical protein